MTRDEYDAENERRVRAAEALPAEDKKRNALDLLLDIRDQIMRGDVVVILVDDWSIDTIDYGRQRSLVLHYQKPGVAEG